MNKPHLSQRQAEVLELFTQGLNNEEIGHRLGIGAGTVNTYVSILRKKYDVRSRSALFLKILSGREWVGLTDEEMEQCYESMGNPINDWALGRAIEAKLKEKNGW